MLIVFLVQTAYVRPRNRKINNQYNIQLYNHNYYGFRGEKIQLLLSTACKTDYIKDHNNLRNSSCINSGNKSIYQFSSTK